MSLEQFVEAFFAVLLVEIVIPGLGHTVSVHEEQIACLQGRFTFRIVAELERAQGQAALLEQFDAAVAANDHRRVVTAGAVTEPVALRIEDRQEERREVLRIRTGVQLLVDPIQYQSGARPGIAHRPERRLQIGRQQTRGHSLAADVGDHQRQLAVVHLDHVVVVAADLLARQVLGRDIDALQGRQTAGQQTALDIAGHGHLFLEFLLGDLFFVQAAVLELQRDLAGDDGQQPDLVELVGFAVWLGRHGHQSDETIAGSHGYQQRDAHVSQQPLFAETFGQFGLFARDRLAPRDLARRVRVDPERLAAVHGFPDRGREGEFMRAASRHRGHARIGVGKRHGDASAVFPRQVLLVLARRQKGHLGYFQHLAQAAAHRTQ